MLDSIRRATRITRRIPIGSRSPRESAAALQATARQETERFAELHCQHPLPPYYLQTILTGHASGPSDPQLELQRGFLRISSEELNLLASSAEAFRRPRQHARRDRHMRIPRTPKLDTSNGSSRDMGSNARRSCHGAASTCSPGADRNAPHTLAPAHRRSIGTSRSRETALEAVAALAADRFLGQRGRHRRLKRNAPPKEAPQLFHEHWPGRLVTEQDVVRAVEFDEVGALDRLRHRSPG